MYIIFRKFSRLINHLVLGVVVGAEAEESEVQTMILDILLIQHTNCTHNCWFDYLQNFSIKIVDFPICLEV